MGPEQSQYRTFPETPALSVQKRIPRLFRRNPRGNRGYQVPPRHQDENRANKYSNTSSSSSGGQQYSQYGGMGAQKSKPPRFQRNQETTAHNPGYGGYQQQQQQQQEPIGTYTKFPQVNEFRTTMPSVAPFPQPRLDAATPRDFPGNAFKQNHQDYQAKVFRYFLCWFIYLYIFIEGGAAFFEDPRKYRLSLF